jgi:glycerol-3-phosphate acyltransferase PlsY
MSANILDIVLPVGLGYLLGSIPSGLLLAKLFGWPDPRAYGSGHIGARNAGRGAGKFAFVLVLIADLGKGAAAVLLSDAVSASEWAVVIGGTAAVIGHNWPVWLNFSGGMGLATAAGVALVRVWPLLAVMLVLLAVIRFVFIKHTPRATIATCLLVTPIAWLVFRYTGPDLWLAILISLLLAYRHLIDWNRVYENEGLLR